MAGIPENLIFKILLLLPVSSVVRFRCVSKQWRDLIDSPHFRRIHFNNCPIKQRDRPQMIFYEGSYPYMVKLDSIGNDDLPPPILKELPIPWWPEGNICQDHGGVAACNGLICVHDIGHGAIIWNPSTGKHLRFRLPEQLNSVDLTIRSWGFGYDSVSDDYKVVIIVRWDMGGYESDGYSPDYVPEPLGAWIYSVRSGSWRNLPDFPQWVVQQQGVFAGGSLHWAVKDSGWNSIPEIVGLDLDELKYKVMDLPVEIGHRSEITVAAVDGCICLSSVSEDSGLNVWVMKEYGDWTKLITITNRISSDTSLMTLLGYGDDGGTGKEALLFVTHSNQIIRYEVGTGSFRTLVHYWSASYLGQPIVYHPSLAWPQTPDS